LCTIFLPSKAQEMQPMEFGVKGGLNISNLYTNEASIPDVIFGFNAGVYLKVPVTKIIAIQPEFYASTKGATIRYNSTLLDGTARFDLTYLELPVFCVIKVSDKVNLQIGPYISCLVDGKVTNMVNINFFDYQKNIDVSKYNRIDAGLILGTSVVVHSVTVGMRYNYGFVTVGKEQTFSGISYIIPNATNGVISFYLSIPVFSDSKSKL